MDKELENKSDKTKPTNNKITELTDKNLDDIVGGECVFIGNTTDSYGGAVYINEKFPLTR